jgi:hypothetical protein
MFENLHKKPIIGIMGGAAVSKATMEKAYDLGKKIAENGWILLNGGRDAGVMLASAKGAKSANGLTIGILPGHSKNEANPFIDIPIVTAMADARNLINVLSSDIIVACKGSAGTLSEIALALKNNKPLILLDYTPTPFFQEYTQTHPLYFTPNSTGAIEIIKNILAKTS